MARFKDKEAIQAFEQEHCSGCINKSCHLPDVKTSCPIMDIHYLFNDDQDKFLPPKEEPQPLYHHLPTILGMFIMPHHTHGGLICRMFTPRQNPPPGIFNSALKPEELGRRQNLAREFGINLHNHSTTTNTTDLQEEPENDDH